MWGNPKLLKSVEKILRKEKYLEKLLIKESKY